MKKRKYSRPYYSRDYFTQEILPNTIRVSKKSIRQTIPFRQHEDLEFLLIRSGEAMVTLNAKDYPAERGCLFCFSPTHFHKLDFSVSTPMEVSECHVNSGVYFYISACPYYESDNTKLPYPPVYARLDEERTQQTEQIIDQLAAMCEKVPIEDNQPAFFLLMKLFGLLEMYAAEP